MTESFTVFGMTFYLYGLIVGLAIWWAVSLVEKKALLVEVIPKKISVSFFWKIIVSSFVFGIFGARLWHVVTDFYLYSNAISEGNLWPIFQIWNGGLSILGAIMGGVMGVAIVLWWRERNLKKLFLFLDLVVFGLPFGQALGRFANYINQELYGLPSDLPWAIFIDRESRLLGFENISFYHPLFLYEAILMLIFGLVVWKVDMSQKNLIGKGKYFFSYVIYYAVIRFFLDFLRLGKIVVIGNLGVNQIFLLILLIVIMLAKLFNFRRIINSGKQHE